METTKKSKFIKLIFKVNLNLSAVRDKQRLVAHLGWVVVLNEVKFRVRRLAI